jgi:shikimate kinase
MPSVAQIFKVHSEAFFRDNEVAEFIWLILSSVTSDLNEKLQHMSSVDIETEVFVYAFQSSVLRDLSSMRRLVVATGGGAVIRPVNWYLELTLFLHSE